MYIQLLNGSQAAALQECVGRMIPPRGAIPTLPPITPTVILNGGLGVSYSLITSSLRVKIL